jgi:hypothetical protein
METQGPLSSHTLGEKYLLSKLLGESGSSAVTEEITLSSPKDKREGYIIQIKLGADPTALTQHTY